MIPTYTYDDFGRLWKVQDWANRTTTYGYDDASRLTRIDRPNGTYRVQEYDDANRLRFIKEYKSSGAVIALIELRYDADGRVTYEMRSPKTSPILLPSDTLIYDDDNRLSTWNGGSVSFDEDGNMTHGPLPNGAMGTYGYDARNRLTSAGDSSYRYNPDGLRVEVNGTGAATYVVDPNAKLSRVLSRTKGDVTTYYVYGLGLLYEETNSAIKTYHFDQVGSTIAITDASQNVTDRIGYSPYGRTTERSGSTDTAFLFNGELGVMTDGNCEAGFGTITGNGLVYMRARYYNAREMRFVNADPIEFDGGLNWYAFVKNNPVSSIDPSGLWDSDYHLDRTNGLARGAGFSRADATRIAHADNNVDSLWRGRGFLPIVGNQGYHFNTNDNKIGSIDSRIAYSEMHLAKAISYQVKSNSLAKGGFLSRLFSSIFHKLAMTNLGRALHPAQDVAPHNPKVQKNAGGLYYYHDQDGVVDNQAKNPEEKAASDDATKSILERYKAGVAEDNSSSPGVCKK